MQTRCNVLSWKQAVLGFAGKPARLSRPPGCAGVADNQRALLPPPATHVRATAGGSAHVPV